MKQSNLNILKSIRNDISASINPQYWSDIEIYLGGETYFNSLINSIDSARESINFESYIFDNDKIGLLVLKALDNASKRGVKVRLIVDGFGSSKFQKSYSEIIKQSKINLRIYHKINIPHSLFKFKTLINSIYKINKRNHRKVCTIDSNLLFIGSRNVTIDHLEKELGGSGWNDVSVKVKGESVKVFDMAFEKIWHPVLWRLKYKTIYSYIKKGIYTKLLRLNFTHNTRKKGFEQFKSLIINSNKRVFITNAYFVPPPYFNKCIIKSKKKQC